MPQMNTIVLKDDEAVDHSFQPNDITNGVASLVESTGVPVGDRKLTVSSTKTTTGRRKIVCKLNLPVVQDAVVNGVSRPTVVRTAYAEVTFSLDGTSNTQERKDILGLMWSLAGSTFLRSIVQDLQSVY